jgi:hypothetical protein
MTVQLPRARVHLKEAEVLTVLGTCSMAGLAACDLQRLTAVRAEDVADRLRGRAREPRHKASLLLLALAGRELGADARGLRRPRGEASLRGAEPNARLVGGARVLQEPAVILEEADHRGVLLQRGNVIGELPAEVGRGAGVGRNRRGTENESSETRDKGFQGMTSAWGTRPGRAPQTGRRERAERPPFMSAGSDEPSQASRAHADRLRNLHSRCHNRCPCDELKTLARQRETPLAGRFRLRDRDSNPNFRSQNPASYH